MCIDFSVSGRFNIQETRLLLIALLMLNMQKINNYSNFYVNSAQSE